VRACPENRTLYLSPLKQSGIMKPWIYAVSISLLFLGGSLLARAIGHRVYFKEPTYHRKTELLKISIAKSEGLRHIIGAYAPIMCLKQ
jgi:hypothetical protein